MRADRSDGMFGQERKNKARDFVVLLVQGEMAGHSRDEGDIICTEVHRAGLFLAAIYSIGPLARLSLGIRRENAILCRYTRMAGIPAVGLSSLRRKSVRRGIIDEVGVCPSVRVTIVRAVNIKGREKCERNRTFG